MPTRKNVSVFVAVVKALLVVRTNPTRVVVANHRVRAHPLIGDHGKDRVTADPLTGFRETVTKPVANAIQTGQPVQVKVRRRAVTPMPRLLTGQLVTDRLRVAIMPTGAAQVTIPITVLVALEIDQAVLVVVTPATTQTGVAIMLTGVVVGKHQRRPTLKSRFSKPTPGWRVTRPTGVPTAVVIAEASAKKIAG